MNANLQSGGAAPHLIRLLTLGVRARDAVTPQELAFIAVNETRELIEYRQAALWFDENLQGVVAVSGVAQPDASAPYLQWLNRLFKVQACISHEVKQLHAGDLTPMLGEEWGQWLPQQALLIPLFNQKVGTLGTLLLARDAAWQPNEIELAKEVCRIYAHAALALRPARSLSSVFYQWVRTRKWSWRATVAVVIVLCLPVRLSSLMPAEITPQYPFVVRAPLEGVVDRFQVRPNEFVAEGAPLFNLDTTALETKNATAQEEYATAQEEYRQSAQLAVTDDKAKLDMALHKGEMDQRAVDLAYSANQLARVQVKAARAGVAVFADVHDWIGRAVVIGEKVLVLADPDKVELTAHMPVASQILVQPGDEIVFYPQATPFSSYTAIIDSVAYHAEPADDNVLAYRIRAHFVQSKALPRLGLMGSARVYSHRVPLVYLMLRRPLAVLRQWLGW